MPSGVYVRSQAIKDHMREIASNRIMSPETRKKIGDFNRGKPIHPNLRNYLDNRIFSPEHLANLRKAFKGRIRDEKPSYRAAHKRVVSARGLAIHCEHCGANDNERKYHWAYTGPGHDSRELVYSANVEDYISLCVRCHRRFDKSDED